MYLDFYVHMNISCIYVSVNACILSGCCIVSGAEKTATERKYVTYQRFSLLSR